MRLANQDWDLYLMEGITSVKRLKYDNSFDLLKYIRTFANNKQKDG